MGTAVLSKQVPLVYGQNETGRKTAVEGVMPYIENTKVETVTWKTNKAVREWYEEEGLTFQPPVITTGIVRRVIEIWEQEKNGGGDGTAT